MKRYIFLLILIFIVVALSSCSGDKRPRYKNLAFEFLLKYNPSWEVKERISSAIVAFLAPKQNDLDFFQETVTITVQELLEPISLSKYTSAVVEQTKAMKMIKDVDVGVIESSPLTLSGVPAHKLIYTLTQYGNPPQAVKAGILPSVDAEGTTIKIMLVWAIRRSKVYLITFVSQGDGYDAHLKDVEGMLQSFRFM
ncbi:MAG TPA: hypothetical protein PKO44_05565 [Candidatus Omnitrophota bacterium]|nr:hypothetical protein [Candidatus Omnitrophota bacterium]